VATGRDYSLCEGVVINLSYKHKKCGDFSINFVWEAVEEVLSSCIHLNCVLASRYGTFLIKELKLI